MTYKAKEDGLYLGNPQELYLFSWGDTPTEYFYTSGDETESYGGDSYTPYPIKRGSIGLGDDILILTVPIDCPVVSALQYQLVLNLTIYREHRDDAETIVLWKGRVMGAKYKGDVAELECWTLLKLLELPMPQFIFQVGCNWQVYSTRCGLNPAGNDVNEHPLTTTIVVGSIDGSKIISEDIDIDDEGEMYNKYFTGGYAEWTDSDGEVHRRFIIESDCRLGASSYIKVLYPFPSGLVATESMNIMKGCLRNKTMCENEPASQNFAQYSGFPWIPERNPFEDSIW